MWGKDPVHLSFIFKQFTFCGGNIWPSPGLNYPQPWVGKYPEVQELLEIYENHIQDNLNYLTSLSTITLVFLKADMPLQPIVSSIGTIFYECACNLAKVLSPLVGKTEGHVRNSNKFVKEVRRWWMHSYDMSALFTSVLINKALEVIMVKLEEDNTLSETTPL